MYFFPPVAFLNSSFAASKSCDCVKRSRVVRAITFAATIIPLKPNVEPIDAVLCQLCVGTPRGRQQVVSWTVGVMYETSPTSVEPGIIVPLFMDTRLSDTFSESGSPTSSRDTPQPLSITSTAVGGSVACN